MESARCPFSAEQELYRKLSDKVAARDANQANEDHFLNDLGCMPGYPQLLLSSTELSDFLQKDIMTPDLDKLAPYLWMMSREGSHFVSSLTQQRVRGRRIIITEDPQLHLVWTDDFVFIKPLPKHLVSSTFWDLFLTSNHKPHLSKLGHDQQQRVRRAAKGFLRSYAYLIQYKSDFDLATSTEHRLLLKNVRYKDLVQLLKACKDGVSDDDASPRYQYGDLRLTRLNFWCKFILRRYTFQKIKSQYTSHFAYYYGPLLFVFALMSLLLDGLQVELAALPILDPGAQDGFATRFSRASSGITLTMLGIIAAVTLYLFMMWLGLFIREILIALQHHTKWFPRRR